MEDECNCQTPGDRNKDFITATAPGPGGLGRRLSWYARKDCPLHGIKDLTPKTEPQRATAE